jgi:hypothetical protein
VEPTGLQVDGLTQRAPMTLSYPEPVASQSGVYKIYISIFYLSRYDKP